VISSLDSAMYLQTISQMPLIQRLY